MTEFEAARKGASDLCRTRLASSAAVRPRFGITGIVAGECDLMTTSAASLTFCDNTTSISTSVIVSPTIDQSRQATFPDGTLLLEPQLQHGEHASTQCMMSKTLLLLI